MGTTSSVTDDITDFERGWHFEGLSDEKTALEHYDRAVMAGDNIARWHRNTLYRKNQNYLQVTAWLELSQSEQDTLLSYYRDRSNSPHIQTCIGLLHLMAKQYDRAVHWLNMAVETGNSFACNLLGWYHENILNNYIQAQSLYEKANDGYSCNNLGKLFCKRKDYISAFRWFFTADQFGHPLAKIYLGNLYYKGVCVPQNISMALKYFHSAADLGCTEAYSKLASVYHAQHDHHEAYKWYKLAANHGDVKAIHTLGVYHACGCGVDLSPNDAIKYFTLAAQTNPEYQYKLGIIYYKGQYSIEKNIPEALRWLSSAAIQDHIKAQDILRKHYDSANN